MDLSGPDLGQIFMPQCFAQRDKMRNQECSFVHYTSADTAISILRKGEVWLRNASCMNDFSEVTHGLECLHKAWDGPIGNQFKAFLNGRNPVFLEKFVSYFNSLQPLMRFQTYFSCLSEHPPAEDEYGRLSMWRAYGGLSGVALVMHADPFFRESNALGCYTFPVNYADDRKFNQQFSDFLSCLTDARDVLANLSEQELQGWLFHTFLSFALCTKHPAFEEEREWRIVYSTYINKSNNMIEEVVSVRGVPQKIFKIRLKNIPEEGLYGIEPGELLKKILVGPSQFPVMVIEALNDILRDLNIPEPEKIVRGTFIPLRV